jgi:hypothetical protein
MSDITRRRRADKPFNSRETYHFLDELKPAGGARRDRTDDLLLAKQALSQLSYGPSGIQSHQTVARSAHDRRRLACKTGGPGKI